MTELPLESLLLSHAAGETDKAGISRLELWISSRTEEGSLDNANVVSDLRKAIANNDMAVAGRWAATDYLIERLNLRSEDLANTIEAMIERPECAHVSTPYDEFSAWFALYHAGGALTPRMLTGPLASLRARAPTLWLDLALIGFAGNDEALSGAVEEMVGEGILRPQDLETRYRAIEAALRTSNLTDFLHRIVAASQNVEFTTHLADWAKRRHNIDLILKQVPSPEEKITRAALDTASDIWLVISNLKLPRPRFRSVLA